MKRFLYALIFSATLFLFPVPAIAGPWGGETPSAVEPTRNEIEAERRSKRNALILLGLLALFTTIAVTYQWGREIREMLPGRRRPVMIDELEEDY